MRESGSSASVGEGLALGWLFSMAAAGCLSLHLAFLLRGSSGDEVLIGASIGLAVTAVLAYMAGEREQDARRQATAIVLILALPCALLLAGLSGIAFGWIGMGGIASALAMPLVQWCCGTGPVPEGGKEYNPIPGAMLAGILLFALPGASAINYAFGAGFFGSMLMVASAGGMLARTRQVGRSVIVDANTIRRAIGVAGVMVLLCAVAGLSLPALTELGKRDFPQVGNGRGLRPTPFSPGPNGAGAGVGTDSQTNAPSNLDGPARPGQTPGERESRAASPTEPPPPPKPEPPKLDADLALKVLALGAAAAILLWLAKRYGAAIQRFVSKAWNWLIAPFLRWRRLRKERAIALRHEAKIAAALARLGDPFEEVPESASSDRIYDALLANAYLLGTSPHPSETVSTFVERLNRSYAVDANGLRTIARVCSRSIFAPLPPTDNETRAAAEHARAFARKVQLPMLPHTLESRKQDYRRLLAERAVAEAEAESSLASDASRSTYSLPATS